jgi:branched-chain amino acid transport system substrate-binding protein
MRGPQTRTHRPRMSLWQIRYMLAAIAIFAIAGLAACGGSDSGGGGGGDGQIVLGMETSLSGSDAAFGEANRDGARLAIKQANADGGILDGRKVELQADDDEARPEVAVGICKKYSTRAAVMLTSFSYTSIPCAEVTENKIPQIAMVATSHDLTEQGNEWIFRVPVPDTRVAADVIGYAADQGYERVALIHANDDFGNAGAESLEAAAKEKGLDMVAKETFVVGDREFSAQLGSIADAKPDVVLSWGNFAEAAAIVKQRGNFGLEDTPWIESDGAASPEYVELGGDATTGVLYSSHWSETFESPTNAEFIAAFEEEYGRRPDLFATEGYTAALVAIKALEEAGTDDEQKVRDAVAATDLETPMGKISFDEKGDPSYGTFLVRIEGGGKESVAVGR